MQETLPFPLFEHGKVTECIQEELEACVRRLDGTNPCIFLAVKNVDKILSTSSTVNATTKLKEQVENAMQKLPEQINCKCVTLNLRDICVTVSHCAI